MKTKLYCANTLSQSVIFSEGALYLDDCDFSRSSARVLVYSGDESNTLIRNAILGDENCETILWFHWLKAVFINILCPTFAII